MKKYEDLIKKVNKQKELVDKRKDSYDKAQDKLVELETELKDFKYEALMEKLSEEIGLEDFDEILGAIDQSSEDSISAEEEINDETEEDLDSATDLPSFNY